MKKTIFIFFIFVNSISFLFAQVEIQKSRETDTYNGKQYYIHTIGDGQTVFSIAKAYGVTVNEIYEANPFAKEGLKTGHLLRIPVESENKISGKESPEISDIISDSIFLLKYIAEEDLLVSQLAKKFELRIQDILKYNTDFEKKEIIRKDDILQIPVKSSAVIADYLLKKPLSQVFMLMPHKILKGETLYSIAREYGCSVNELLSFNPGMDERIIPDQYLYVPAKNQFETKQPTEKLPQPECRKKTGKHHYSVALLLPLYLEQAESIIIDQNIKQNLTSNYKSFDYIQFYEGFLLALNTADLNNATVSLEVYDVTDGEEKISRLQSKGLLDVDLIIGPFMKTPLEVLSKWSEGKKSFILDLYMPEEVDYSLSNPNLLSAIPSVSEQLMGLLEFIRDFEQNKNVIVVYNDNKNETLLINKIKDLQNSAPGYNIQFYLYGSEGISGLVKMLDPDIQNILINFSNNEVFLNNFTRSLFDYAEKYPVTLFGLPSWLRYESLDLRYLNHFNTHFISSQFIDYSKDRVISFVSEFQNVYQTDPNRMAFLGYDVAIYFFEMLTKYGDVFPYCLKDESPELLSTGFQFERQGESGQLQNMYVSIYELFDSRRKPGKNR